MIFYFSGTGNSRWAAELLGNSLKDRVIPISESFASGRFSYNLDEGEALGFVFPTYSWGPPPVMEEFVKRLDLKGYTNDTYCYMVATCGDDVGLLVDMWKKVLGDIRLNAAYTVVMPNNYILLPGFDVDDDATERRKKRNAIGRVKCIASHVKKRKEEISVYKGHWAWVKSRVINPWFRRNCMSDSKFVVNADKCIRCGICVNSCPMKNVKMNDGVPSWHGNCAMCLACIHHCPQRAIEYAKATRKKGRYVFTPFVKYTKKHRKIDDTFLL